MIPNGIKINPGTKLVWVSPRDGDFIAYVTVVRTFPGLGSIVECRREDNGKTVTLGRSLLNYLRRRQRGGDALG